MISSGGGGGGEVVILRVGVLELVGRVERFHGWRGSVGWYGGGLVWRCPF